MRVITLINDLMMERFNIKETVKENQVLDFSTESDAIKKVQQHKRGELKEKLRQYEATNLEKHLIENGWCQRMSHFLWQIYESEANSGRAERRDDLGSVISKDVPYRAEHDAIEKVCRLQMSAIFIFSSSC